jgi:hypothetical protein
VGASDGREGWYSEPGDVMAAGSYHYVVVGTGSAGCVLANRLSADPAPRVALLEAGGPDRRREIRIPAAITKLFLTDYDWNFRTTKQPQLSDRECTGQPVKPSAVRHQLMARYGYVGTASTTTPGRKAAPAGLMTRCCHISSEPNAARAATPAGYTAPGAHSSSPSCGTLTRPRRLPGRMRRAGYAPARRTQRA